MKLKKLFALALAVCMMALAVPAAFAAGLTLDYGTTPTTPVVEEPTQRYSTYADYPVMPLEVDSDNDLHLTKTAVYQSSTNTVDVTITAYASGVMSTETIPKPTDFVLVLDRSNSMRNPYVETAKLTLSSLNARKPSGYYCAVYVEDGWVDTHHYFHVRYDATNGWQIMLDGSTAGWQSASTDYVFGTGRNDKYTVTDFYITKIGAMMDAASGFVNNVHEKAAEDATDHRIAIVSYAGSADIDRNLTQLYIPREADASEEEINAANAQGVTNLNALNSAINALSVAAATEGTKIDTGLDKANDIFTGASETRAQIVVTLTDGVPSTTDGTGNTFVEGLANEAIEQANDLKDKEILVYTIGIFDDANPGQLFGSSWDYLLWSVPCDGTVGSYWGASGISSAFQAIFGNGFPEIDIPAGNRLLNYISNNYSVPAEEKNKIGIIKGTYNPSNAGTDGTGYIIDVATAPGSNQGYYLTADNMSDLNDAFDDITDTVTSSDVTLDDKAAIFDVVDADCFGTPTDIKVQVAAYQGGTSFGDPSSAPSTITGTYEDGAVVVTGFDYKTQMAKTNPTTHQNSGQMLIVTYSLPVRSGFLGGNNIPVSVVDESGVFAFSAQSGYALTENFSASTVSVPVPEISVTAENKNVYLLGSIDTTHMLTNATATAGGASLDLDATNYGLEEWQYEYVDIEVSSGIVDTEPPFNGTNDGKYTVSCTITSRANSGNTKTGSETCDINVFKPMLEYPDYTIYLGGKNPEFAYDATKTAWMHGTTNAVNVNDMIGTDPVVTVTAFDKDIFKNCEDVNLAAANAANIGGTDVTAHVQVKPFKVHVKTPVIKCDGKTIFYGDEATLVADIQEAWTSCGCNDAPANMSNAKPTEKAFTYSGGANVKPSECTTYTVTLDSIGTASVSDLNFVGKTTTATVHVLIPEITMNEEDIIYYGDTADLEHKLNWVCTKGCQVDIPNGAPVDKDDCTFSCGSLRLTGCDTNVTVSVEVDGKTFNGKNNAAIHVLKPEITAANKTLYWTQPYGLNSSMTTEDKWKCKHTDNERVDLGAAPEPDFTFVNNDAVETNETDLVLDDCTTYDVTAKINGLDFPLDKNNNSVTVHVVKPVISCADTAIYLGNSVDLNAQMTEDPAWKCTTATCPGHVTLAVKDNADNRVAPALDHVFSTVENEAAYEPSTCTPVTVTSTIKTDSVSKDVTPTQNTFTVHVYVPQFTVTTQDLWADCGENVDLNLALKSDPTWTWVDRKADYNTAPTTGEQVVDNISVQFEPDNSVNPLGESDVDVNVNSLTCKVNGVDYIAVEKQSGKTGDEQLVIVPFDDAGHDFTVHVNKFKAVITNNGTQNAIYTLSNGTKVAVPAKGSVTVAGLICGKEYAISETADNDWTWRYATEATKNTAAYTVGSVDNKPETDSSVNVDMNYGEKTNTKWLADEDCVVNKATTQATTINPTLSVKKKDEEVTNA